MFTITGVSQAQLEKLVAGLKADPDTSLTEPSPGSYQIVGHGVTAVAAFSGEVLSVSITKKPWAYPMSAVVSRVEAAIKEELAK